MTEANWLAATNPAHARTAELAFQRLEVAEAQGAQQTVENRDDRELRALLASLTVEEFLIETADNPEACVVLGPNHPVLLKIMSRIKTKEQLALVCDQLSYLLSQTAFRIVDIFQSKDEGEGKNHPYNNFHPPIAERIVNLYFLPNIDWSLLGNECHARVDQGRMNINYFYNLASAIKTMLVKKT